MVKECGGFVGSFRFKSEWKQKFLFLFKKKKNSGFRFVRHFGHDLMFLSYLAFKPQRLGLGGEESGCKLEDSKFSSM